VANAIPERNRSAAPQSPSASASLKGRGAADNPANRFERLHYEVEGDDEANARDESDEFGVRPPPTLYLRDPSRRIISTNESPDVPFDASINPYRGCEHGCIYCYARPTHEYLGLSAGLDFETRILVKDEAPALLRRELSAKSWTPQVLGFSGVTDPYQPVERSAQLTRRCLEVLAEFRNPLGIITKNALVVRDVDVLQTLVPFQAVAVNLSITTLDRDLHRRMEPRSSSPKERLRAVERLAAAGIPVGVMVAPVIPGLTDHEIPAILEAAASAGASWAGYIMLRLPHGVAPLFEQWLDRHYPERSKKVLDRLRGMRGGRLNDPQFKTRMRGQGIFAEHVAQLFALAAKRQGLDRTRQALSAEAFRVPGRAQQLGLF
jgi:DNA repair photolyase